MEAPRAGQEMHQLSFRRLFRPLFTQRLLTPHSQTPEQFYYWNHGASIGVQAYSGWVNVCYGPLARYGRVRTIFGVKPESQRNRPVLFAYGW